MVKIAPYQIIRILPEHSVQAVVAQHHTVLRSNQPVTIAVFVSGPPNTEIAKQRCVSLANTIARETARRINGPVVDALEESLKFSNPFLDQIQNDLGEKLDVAVLVTLGSTVHFANVNDAKVYLSSTGKLSDVTENSSNSRAFSAITSGELENNDMLIVGNADFIHQLQALDAVIWEQPSPIGVAENLAILTDEATAENIAGYMFKFDEDNPLDETAELVRSEQRLPLNLPKIPRLALPKLSLKLPTMTGKSWGNLKSFIPHISPPNKKVVIGVSLVLLVLIGGVFFYKKPKVATEPAKASPSLSDTLGSLSGDSLDNYLSKNVSLDTFNNQGSAEQQKIIATLTAKNISVIKSPQIASQLPETVAVSAVLDTTLYLIDQTGQLWKYSNSKLIKIDQSQLVPQPLSLTVLNENKIVVSDQSGGIYLFDGSKSQPIKLSTPNNWPSGGRLVNSYNANLYIYNLTDNSVYRVSNFDKSLSSSLYTKGGTLSFSSLKDWSIPSVLLGIDASGKVLTWQRNTLEKTTFTLSNVANLVSLTNNDSSSIYICNGKFIDIYDASGNFIKKVYLLTNETINSCRLGSNGLWLSYGKNISLLSQP